MLSTRRHSRRTLLAGIGAMGLTGCASTAPSRLVPPASGFLTPTLPPIEMRPNRITKITVCLRPFRAAGPRLDVETVGDKRVVHNYGHGGSGWSLSWGSSAIATAKALEGGTRDVAVIGCGALGLTSALLLRRAGANVTIYAAERLSDTRSARATGNWSPDSRIADAARVSADFPALWEQMARTSYAAHQTYVGQAGEPVSWRDIYFLQDGDSEPEVHPPADAITFAKYGGRVRDLAPRSHALTPGQHPFPVKTARRGTSMTYNVAELAHRLTTDFLLEGGRIETMVFHTPADLSRLSQPVVVNCTGYGARALWKDDTITPVRGQIAWLPPQPEVRYSLTYRAIGVIPRPDGIVVQNYGDSEMYGYGLDDESPDRAEAEAAIAAIAPLFVGRAAV